MAEEDSQKGLLEGMQPYSPQPIPNNEYNEALFHEQGKSPKEKLIMYLFIAVFIIIVMITVILSLYRGIVVDSTYILLGVSIISIGLVEVVLVYWSKTGELAAEKLWFLYFVGICITLEAIFTDVLLYHRPLV